MLMVWLRGGTAVAGQPITPLWPFTPHSWRLLGWEGAWYSRAALLLSITEAKLTILNIAVVLFSYKCKAER